MRRKRGGDPMKQGMGIRLGSKDILGRIRILSILDLPLRWGMGGG